MAGKKKHGPARRRGARRPFERRTPPAESTGLEAKFLRERVHAGATVAVHLTGGEVVKGAIGHFDRELITIARGDGEDVVLRKSDVRYIEDSPSR